MSHGSEPFSCGIAKILAAFVLYSVQTIDR